MIDNQAISNRLKVYFSECGIQQKDIAERLGVSQAAVSALLNGKPFGKRVAEKWGEEFGIKSSWLITGEGGMLRNSSPAITSTIAASQSGDRSIALYNLPTTDLVEFFNNLPKPIDRFVIPNMPKCDGAVMMRGETMRPNLNGGDIALYKRINVKMDNILWGNMYLLSFEGDNKEEHIGIHTIRHSDDADRIRLVNDNTYYPSMDVSMSAVKAMAIIKASIRYNTMS